jgi:lipoprotein-releasing system ATP-binding protein
MAELSVAHLAKEYPSRGEPVVVLRDVNLQLARGENIAIVGPSGCGKSTLLHIIGTLDRPTSGTVRLTSDNGGLIDPFALAEPELARLRNHTIGFVFQDHLLLPQCTALENVLMPTMADGTTAQATERGRLLLERVGLGHRLEHRPAELSGGERQRVAIARALVNKPALLLADEPTGNLDRGSATAIGELLIELQSQEGFMLIVVTHSLELASRLSRRMTIDGGRLLPLEVDGRPATTSPTGSGVT